MQLDLFTHTRDVGLRNDAIAALRTRNADAARKALAALAAEYPALGPEAASAAQERSRQAWEEITRQAEPSPLARR